MTEALYREAWLAEIARGIAAGRLDRRDRRVDLALSRAEAYDFPPAPWPPARPR